LFEHLLFSSIDEGVDYESFVLLTDEDLKVLGFNLGQRRKILESLRVRNQANVPAVPTPSPIQTNSSLLTDFMRGQYIRGIKKF